MGKQVLSGPVTLIFLLDNQFFHVKHGMVRKKIMQTHGLLLLDAISRKG
jgi:hypothetical protein